MRNFNSGDIEHIKFGEILIKDLIDKHQVLIEKTNDSMLVTFYLGQENPSHASLKKAYSYQGTDKSQSKAIEITTKFGENIRGKSAFIPRDFDLSTSKYVPGGHIAGWRIKFKLI